MGGSRLKVVSFNREDQTLIISCDYWEIESMGYDIKKQKDMTGHFYETVLSEMDIWVKKYFSNHYKYGIKTMIDEVKGVYYYKIMPYEDRLNEFIITEMMKNGRKWVMYDNEIWTTGI